MTKMIHLVEQHMLQSESELRHIDELMARAHEARAKMPLKPATEAELIRIQGERAKGAQELTTLRQQAHDDSDDMVKRSEGLKGVLQTVGLELEKALATIF